MTTSTATGTATTTGSDTARASTRVFDHFGVEILVGDTVIVTSWGGSARASDCRSRFIVTGATPRGNVTHDTDVANGRAVGPGHLAVARRDGEQGYEGNRNR